MGSTDFFMASLGSGALESAEVEKHRKPGSTGTAKGAPWHVRQLVDRADARAQVITSWARAVHDRGGVSTSCLAPTMART